MATVEASHDGLSSGEARARLAAFGPNSLPEGQRRTLLSVFAGQFKNPLIYLLFVAAGISMALGHLSDAVVIAVVVVVNAIVGTVQEGRAEQSLAALRRLGSARTRVLRDGVEQAISADEVVPGDVMVLDAGDAVTADARLLHGAALQIAEASLTGESVPVAKSVATLADETPLADRTNMVHAGTHVTAGRARALVVGTGLSTEIGRIARLAESATQPPTPLERRVSALGRVVMVAAVPLFVVIVLTGWLQGRPLGQIAMVGISQLVGMVPEGLPVAMTIGLAIGVQRMARRRAVVRRLSAVETLGSTSVICTDKTGTLTRNEMTVVDLLPASGRRVEVEGTGYAPQGGLLHAGARVEPADDPVLAALLEAALLCNDASLVGPSESEPGWKPVGDPTEVALVTLGIKAGLVPAAVRGALPRRAELPFDPAVKLMATQHVDAAGSRVFVKGAPEMLLPMCGSLFTLDGVKVLDDAARAAWGGHVDEMASRALRVLAIGVVHGGAIDGSAGIDAFSQRVTLLGLVGQIDPPRDEVADAIRRCHHAGIRVVMVTGDHRNTGRAIARQLGISGPDDEAVDGVELERMTDDELARRIDRIAVFARVHPAQKLRIVDAFQRQGQVVAMTGDGVNDAPALVKANVGVAMGITGTEVAKDSAKIVIGDDNFATIVAAVEEGRVVYQNLRKSLNLLLSTSGAEVVILLLAMLLGFPPPFAAVQILWNNLVTEGLITVNLANEPAEGDEMSRRPVRLDEALIPRATWVRLLLMTATISGVTLGWIVWRTSQGADVARVQTEAFTLLAVCEWFNVLSCRSETASALNLSVLKNRWLVAGLVAGNLLQALVVYWPPLAKVLHVVPLDLGEVLAIGVVGSLVLWVEEARKWLVRRRLSAA
jgi:Ca2+-transporting ATPase